MVGVPFPVAMIVSAGPKRQVRVRTLTCKVLCACAESMFTVCSTSAPVDMYMQLYTWIWRVADVP